MKAARASLLAMAVLLTLTGNSHAQIVMGANTAVIDDSSVSTQGVEIWGGDATGSFTLSNGVQFNNVFNNAHWVPGNIPVSYPGFPVESFVEVDEDGAAFGDQTGNLGFGDNALNGALANNAATGGQLFLYIANLTPGAKYLLQSFAAMTSPATGGFDNGAGSYNATETVTYENGFFTGPIATTTLQYGLSSGGSGAYSTTDTFVANSSGTAFFMYSGSDNGIDLLAAAQIREIPEPSTYALMFAGLALLGFCLRHKGALV